jgi:hypothetical protein
MMAPRNAPVVLTYPNVAVAKAYAHPTPKSAGSAMTTRDHAER